MFAGYDMPVRTFRDPSPSTGTAMPRRRCSTSRTWARCGWSAPTPTGRSSRWCQSTLGLGVDRQRYGFFTDAAGGILDDLMITRRADDA